MNNQIYEGTEFWVKIDKKKYVEDGILEAIQEPTEVDATRKKVNRSGFEITYLSYLFDIFDKLGGQRYKVFKYIVENKSRENILIITQRELAEKTKTSTKTVNETLKFLKDINMISIRTGAIMLAPKVAHYGGIGTERYLLQKFEAFDE